jgi:general secretion pathway protein F
LSEDSNLSMPDQTPDVGPLLRREASGHTISIDHFVALNDELAAIVRAGLPMERSLRQVGRDIPGTLGKTIQSLATRLSHGETLPQALAAERHRFPGAYGAVVEAGLKAGRLCAALEGLAGFARSYAELRRSIGQALMYPLIVLVLAYVLFVYFVLQVVPKILKTYSLFPFATDPIIQVLDQCRASLAYWGPIVPVVLALFGIWWIQSGRVRMLEPSWGRRVLSWLPWVRGILANARSACFAELLALLVENDVPLHEAIELAAEATGDEATVDEARRVAVSITRGDSPFAEANGGSAFPPMLRWYMHTGLQQGHLASCLRHAASTYRELSLHGTAIVKLLLPVALLLSLGGTAVFVYCISVFVPFTSLMLDLSSY